MFVATLTITLLWFYYCKKTSSNRTVQGLETRENGVFLEIYIEIVDGIEIEYLRNWDWLVKSTVSLIFECMGLL